MSLKIAFWRDLEVALRAGQRAFLALVVDSTAHSPGTTGAGLFVCAERTVGTIGGGVMELGVIERARAVLGAEETVREVVDLRHRRDVEAGEERSGMICAGRQTNLYLTLEPTDVETILAWLDQLQNEQGALRIDSAGLEVMSGDDAPTRDRLERGEAWSYLLPALERRRLAILGGGHCGQALARLMSQLGWRVTVWETRRSLVGMDGFGNDGQSMRYVDDFRDAGALIDHTDLTPVVVMTTDVPNDVRALQGTLRRAFPFVGAMGSGAKLKEIRRRLAEAGLTAEELDRLTAPVGLAVGSETPDEIAVSVAAQLLSRRRDWLQVPDKD